MRKSVCFTVNGKLVEFEGKAVFAPLSDTLRYELRKTGTKVVCAEGDCGACTVMMARVGQSRTPRFRSLNSCIFPTFLADGCHLITVEGLERDGKLHPVQQAMITHFGGQCGFCTPGFVMSLVHLFENKDEPTEKNVKNSLTGNLCRCTGYQPILTAALNVDRKQVPALEERYPLGELDALLTPRIQGSLSVVTAERELFVPQTLAEAVAYRQKFPQARIYSGATDIGVQTNKGKDPGPQLLSLHQVPGLDELTEGEGRIRVGARVTLDRLEGFVRDRIPAVAEFLEIFASPQIKNAATLVGNLANGSPIADTTPFLLALDARVHLVGPGGDRSVALAEFFKGYKEFDLQPGEFIVAVDFLVPPKQATLGLYKVSQRRDLDISCVNAAFYLESQGTKVSKARIAYGGVGPTAIRLRPLEDELEKSPLDRSLVDQLKPKIASAVTPISDVRGTAEFRTAMAAQLWEKFSREKVSL